MKKIIKIQIIFILIISSFINNIQSKHHKAEIRNKYQTNNERTFSKFLSLLSSEEKFKAFLKGFIFKSLKELSNESFILYRKDNDKYDQYISKITDFIEEKCINKALEVYNTKTKAKTQSSLFLNLMKIKRNALLFQLECILLQDLKLVENEIPLTQKIFISDEKIKILFDNQEISRYDLINNIKVQESSIKALYLDNMIKFLKKRLLSKNLKEDERKMIKYALEKLENDIPICDVYNSLDENSFTQNFQAMISAAVEGFSCGSDLVKEIIDIDSILSNENFGNFNKICNFELFQSTPQLQSLFCNGFNIKDIIDIGSKINEIKEKYKGNMLQNGLMLKKDICGIIKKISVISPELNDLEDKICNSINLEDLNEAIDLLKKIDPKSINSETVCKILDQLSFVNFEGDLMYILSSIHFVYCNLDMLKSYGQADEYFTNLIESQNFVSDRCAIVKRIQKNKLSNDLQLVVLAISEICDGKEISETEKFQKFKNNIEEIKKEGSNSEDDSYYNKIQDKFICELIEENIETKSGYRLDRLIVLSELKDSYCGTVTFIKVKTILSELLNAYTQSNKEDLKPICELIHKYTSQNLSHFNFNFYLINMLNNLICLKSSNLKNSENLQNAFKNTKTKIANNIDMDDMCKIFQEKLEKLPKEYSLEYISLNYFNDLFCQKSSNNKIYNSLLNNGKILVPRINSKFLSNKLDSLFQNSLSGFFNYVVSLEIPSNTAVELIQFLLKESWKKINLSQFTKLFNIKSIIKNVFKGLITKAAAHTVFPPTLIYFTARFIVRNITYIHKIFDFFITGDKSNDIEVLKYYRNLGELLANQFFG